MELETRVAQMTPPNSGVLIALSGGADSMALLYALVALRETLSLKLVAAHVHHGLRGAEADRDAAFVREQCEKLHIPCETLFANVLEQRQTGEGVEQAGRRIRYAFFERLREQYNLDYIATAHHADDNLETVLLHLTRGSGLHGLCGIPQTSGCIIRPLLSVSRTEIEAYCAENEIPFVVDSTNIDTAYSRNRMRCEVVPQLKAVNPQVVEAVTRMTANLREEDAFLEDLTTRALQDAVDGDGYLRVKLLDTPLPLLKRALKRIAELAGGDPEEKHILLLAEALQNGGAVQIPGEVRILVSKTHLIVDAPQKLTPYLEQPFKVGDTVEIGNTTYTAVCLSVEEFKEKQNVHKNVLKFVCDYDKIVGSMYIRGRKAGDRFHPVGGVGKSLKKFFNENAVPLTDRGSVPVVCDQEGIILLVGYSCDDRVRLDETTKRVFAVMGGKKSGYT